MLPMGQHSTDGRDAAVNKAERDTWGGRGAASGSQGRLLGGGGAQTGTRMTSRSHLLCESANLIWGEPAGSQPEAQHLWSTYL